MGNNNVHFENGSANQGNGFAYANNYYTVPKEQFNALLESQKKLSSLVAKIVDKLG